MVTKNTLLTSVAAEGNDQLSALSQKWDKLQLKVESHELMMKGQVWEVLVFYLFWLLES